MSEKNLPPSISKTSFLKFDQCAKAFFLYKNFNYLRDPLSREKQLTFNRGHAVGTAAQNLFPGGTDVSAQTANLAEALTLTADLVAKEQPVIYEATFAFNHVLVMVDILRLTDSGWQAYEVKSSLKINETYIKDACLQYYVLKNVLPKLDDFFLVNLNGNYLLEDELNYQQLFKQRSIRTDGEKNLSYFEHQVQKIMLLLEQNSIPDIAIGRHCFSPYTCDFAGTCWKGLDKSDSVFNLGKIGKEQLFDWYRRGITTVDSIPPDEIAEPHIRVQAQSMALNSEYLDKAAVEAFLLSVRGRHCFLDMEIWSSAIPQYKGTGPFAQIPFLFSLCYEANGAADFISYIKPIETDGREEFLVRLLEATDPFDSVVIYDKNLEVHVLNQLRQRFPAYAKRIDKLIEKMKDIAELVHNFSYYHPKFKGNFSLKAVSSVVNGDEGYEKQEISSGLVAMNAYAALLDEKNPIIIESTRQQLTDYCNLDTLTGLKFFNYLRERITGS